MRAFLVDTLLASQKADELVANMPTYPIALTQALCGALLKSTKEVPKYADVVKEHTAGNYVIFDPKVHTRQRRALTHGNNT